MERPWYTRFNWWLAGSCIALTISISRHRVSDATFDATPPGEWKSQAAYALVGIIVMFGAAFIDYHRWQQWWVPVYVVTLLLLVFIAQEGHSAPGAARWIEIGGFTFQPSEPAKVTTAIAVAALLSRSTYRSLWQLAIPLVAVSVPALLILKQPDLGTTLVVGAILTAELAFGLPNVVDFLIMAASLRPARTSSRATRSSNRSSARACWCSGKKQARGWISTSTSRRLPSATAAVVRQRALSRHPDTAELRAGELARFHLYRGR